MGSVTTQHREKFGYVQIFSADFDPAKPKWLADSCANHTLPLKWINVLSSLQTSGHETNSLVTGHALQWAVVPGIIIIYIKFRTYLYILQ